MLRLPTFILDACAWLLLKLSNHNKISYFFSTISDQGRLRCNLESGTVGISDQQLTLFAKPTGIESP